MSRGDYDMPGGPCDMSRGAYDMPGGAYDMLGATYYMSGEGHGYAAAATGKWLEYSHPDATVLLGHYAVDETF